MKSSFFLIFQNYKKFSIKQIQLSVTSNRFHQIRYPISTITTTSNSKICNRNSSHHAITSIYLDKTNRYFSNDKDQSSNHDDTQDTEIDVSNPRQLSADDIAMTLESFHDVDPEEMMQNKELNDILYVFINQMNLCKDTFSPTQISQCLYGFRHMTSNDKNPITKELFISFIELIEQCDGTFTSEDIATSLYGFSSMDSNDTHVREALQILLEKIKNYYQDDVFTPEMIQRSLFGLQLMSCEHEEVRQILAYLVPVIQKCSLKFQASEIAYIMYSLRNKRHETTEMTSLLESLIPKFNDCDDVFTPTFVGATLLGFVNMNSSSYQVRLLLRVLAKKFMQLDGIFQSSDLGNSFFGLRNMSSEEEEVRLMMQVLAIKMSLDADQLSSIGALNLEDMNYAIEFLRSKSDVYPEVLDIIRVITERCVAGGASMYHVQKKQHWLHCIEHLQSSNMEVIFFRSLLTSLELKTAENKKVIDS